MKITELSEYHVRPGRLREWRPHAPNSSTTSALTRDSTPPSYNQERYLKVIAKLRGRGLQLPGWIGVGFEIPHALHVEAFRGAIQMWIERHETLRSGFHQKGGKFHRFTMGHGTVSVTDTQLADFGPHDDVTGYIQDRLAQITDGTRWPSYVVETVERGESTTFIAAFDHSNVDGYSILAAIQELIDLYDASVAMRTVTHSGVGSYVSFSREERITAQRIDRNHPSVVRWARFVEDCGGKFPRFPLDLGVDEGDLVPQVTISEFLLDVPGANAFEAACRAGRSSFLAGVLATVAISAYELQRGSVYRIVTPLHTRTKPEWANSMGWYVGAGPIEIALHGATEFREVLPRAQESARSAVRIAQTPFVRISDLLDLDLPHTPDVFSFISFLDMRDVPGAGRWADWNARTLAAKSYSDKANFWVNRTHQDLHITTRYPDTEVAKQNVSNFISHIRTVLRSITRTGNYHFR